MRTKLLTRWLMIQAVLKLCVKAVDGVSWLSIAAVSGADPGLHAPADCEGLAGLSRRQALVCAHNLELMAPVRQGAAAALAECRHQFRATRWHCGVEAGLHGALGKLAEAGTREEALLHAISSAGVAHSVTKACSSGQLDGCGCDLTVRGPGGSSGGPGGDPEGAFTWAGCSDNTDFGVAFAQSFIDAREGVGERVRERARERALLNLHNNHAGRTLVDSSRQVRCKCHGVSGSCEIKTCFRVLPPFRHIGDTLRAAYDSATRVHAVRMGTRTALVPLEVASNDPAVTPARGTDAAQPRDAIISQSGSPSADELAAFSVFDVQPSRLPMTSQPSRLPMTSQPMLDAPAYSALVYAADSPLYCEPDARVGAVGTRGRVCEGGVGREGEEGSCEVLCCGRGWLMRVRTVTERCGCRFTYCCYVHCQTCRREVVEFVCR